MAVKNGVDASSVEGIVDSPYAIGNMQVECVNPKSAVPVLWWRSVGLRRSLRIPRIARPAQSA
jgi:isoquinoline 1-oxidoreductase beta subunit